MQKNMFPRFSSLLLSGLLMALVGLFGCSKSSTASLSDGEDTDFVTKSVGTTVPYVEPMFPLATSMDAGRTGVFLTRSTSFGKVAQQTVPLPPVADLVAQADDYLAKIGLTLKEDLESSTDYKRESAAVVRDASGLALVALAIGLSPEDSKYKKAAPGIIEAALVLEKAEKFDAANKAYADLQAAFESSGDPSTLSWTKVAALGPAMKAVPNLDSVAKRLSNTEARLKRAPERVTPLLAGIAAIGQGTMANFEETIKPDAEAEWKKESEIFRDAAIEANAAVHKFVSGDGTYADFQAAYDKLAETCDSCHKIFQPNVK